MRAFTVLDSTSKLCFIFIFFITIDIAFLLKMVPVFLNGMHILGNILYYHIQLYENFGVFIFYITYMVILDEYWHRFEVNNIYGHQKKKLGRYMK